MNGEMLITANIVKSFFEFLDNAAIEYALIKNIGGELPHKLKKGKDIDILVKNSNLQRCMALILDNGFYKITHPRSQDTGWSLAYGASDPVMFESKPGLQVDIHCELCLKSLMGNIWIPMDRIINNKAWNDRVWDDDNKWWTLDDKTQLIYLISRCIFDKGSFSETYKEEIIKRIGLLNDDTVQEMLEKVFFRFKDKLCEMLTSGQYNSIIGAYIAFCDY